MFLDPKIYVSYFKHQECKVSHQSTPCRIYCKTFLTKAFNGPLGWGGNDAQVLFLSYDLSC